MALTKNRLIEMMSTVLSMKKSLETFPVDLVSGPKVITSQQVAVAHIRNQVHYLEVVLQGELDLLENK